MSFKITYPGFINQSVSYRNIFNVQLEFMTNNYAKVVKTDSPDADKLMDEILSGRTTYAKVLLKAIVSLPSRPSLPLPRMKKRMGMGVSYRGCS